MRNELRQEKVLVGIQHGSQLDADMVVDSQQELILTFIFSGSIPMKIGIEGCKALTNPGFISARAPAFIMRGLTLSLVDRRHLLFPGVSCRKFSTSKIRAGYMVANMSIAASLND